MLISPSSRRFGVDMGMDVQTLRVLKCMCLTVRAEVEYVKFWTFLDQDFQEFY